MLPFVIINYLRAERVRWLYLDAFSLSKMAKKCLLQAPEPSRLASIRERLMKQ